MNRGAVPGVEQQADFLGDLSRRLAALERTAGRGMDMAALPLGVVSYAKLTSSVTGINSETVITGLTQSFTAAADRLYKVSVALSMQSGGTNASTIAVPSRFSCYGRVKQNGTTIDVIRHDFRDTADAQELSYFFTATFSAGTHELTLTMDDVASGTTDIDVYSGSCMCVEDIGLA